MSTIQDTVFGLYHMFVASKRVTNTEHSHDAHLLLRRMIVHVHYVLVKCRAKQSLSIAPQNTPHTPDVSTFDGVLDLFMLCIVMELGELLNPLAYKKKYRHSRDHDRDRLSIIHARGLSRDLRAWWHANYVFFDAQKQMLLDSEAVFKKLLRQHIGALISYKRTAEQHDIQGEVEECTAGVLENLLKKYFPLIMHSRGLGDKGFEWEGNKYEVQDREEAKLSYTRSMFFFKIELESTRNDMAGHDILTLGATAMDVDFVQQYKRLGVGLEPGKGSSGDSEHGGDNSDPASDDSRSNESGSNSDDPSSSELSDLDSTGMSEGHHDVHVMCSFCACDR